jgi:alkylation response protein AidB-like acyl-CoA dehydrogenase
MEFEFSDSDRLIRDLARRVAKEKVAPRAAELDLSGEYPEDIFAAFRDAGLLGLSIPTEYGGGGAGILGLCLAVEEVAKYCCASGLILLLTALASRGVSIGGTEEQKKQVLPRVASGEWKGSFCLTEPNAGSDAGAIESRAILDGGTYSISGEKLYISGGSVADYAIFWAKTDPSAGAKGINGFIVPTNSEGFSVARTDRKMGVRGVPTANIVLRDVKVPKENLIGGEENGTGFRTLMRNLNSVRPVVGARGVGLAEGALDYALQYARNRKTFGKAIVEHQAIQFLLAEMAIQIEGAKLLVYRAAQMVDRGRFDKADAAYLSVAKAYATEMAERVASSAIQVLGAQGYMMDHPLERHYRDVRQLTIVEGTSQVQRMVIARALIDGDLAYL